VRPAGRGRQHRPHALDFRRPRLRRRGAGTRLAARARAHRIYLRDRRRGARGVPAAGKARRHPARARVVARARARPQARARSRAGGPHPGEPVGPGRQGREHGGTGAPVMLTIASRLDRTFAALRAAGRRGLVTYTPAGDPDLPRSAEVLVALDRGGADVLEVGVPFSDPLADGPVIQRASERALAAGAGLRSVLDMI